jgi:hypothetical protein
MTTPSSSAPVLHIASLAALKRHITIGTRLVRVRASHGPIGIPLTVTRVWRNRFWMRADGASADFDHRYAPARQYRFTADGFVCDVGGQYGEVEYRFLT